MTSIPAIAVIARSPLFPAEEFGQQQLLEALRARGAEVLTSDSGGAEWRIVLDRETTPGAPIGRRAGRHRVVRSGPREVRLTGLDESGLMFGALDLADRLRLGGRLEDVESREFEPEVAVRGIYTFRFHDADLDELDDPDYWARYADQLAHWRYNRFNMIFGHQSPYLIPIYPFLLDGLQERYPEISVEGITSGERARQLRILTLASEAMAQRGIAFTLGIWNSRPWATSGGRWFDQPTRVSGTEDLDRLALYTREAFTQLMHELPAVDGIQLRMNAESGVNDQRFFIRSYVPAVADLVAEGRPVGVELRNWRLEPETIEAFRHSGADLLLSTKYFAEHMGMPYQPADMRGGYSYDSLLTRDRPEPLLWQVWSLGSHRLFNWGDVDYARRLVRSCHLGDGVGFEITPPGSQRGFSQWGEVEREDWRDRTDLPARRDFDRYWFFHMAFGRAGYDLDVPDQLFEDEAARRTSEREASDVVEAYRASSQVVSYLISQRMDDENMYVWPELDAGGPIDHNAIAPPGERTLFATAREHAARIAAGEHSAKRSPFDTASDLDAMADEIEHRLEALAGHDVAEPSVERRTIEVDFAAVAALARYHAAKAAATGHLELFYASGDAAQLDAAEESAREAIRLWDDLCQRTEAYASELHLGPSGGHWRDNRRRAEYDLRRIERVRSFFERWGLFSHGFDFGPEQFDRSITRLVPPRFLTGLTGIQPEPRFERVDAETAHQPNLRYQRARGFGWVDPDGLYASARSYLLRDLYWGVHHVALKRRFDPSIVDAVPMDGLTQSSLGGTHNHTFRVDVPAGSYEVIAVAPTPGDSAVRIRVGSETATLSNGEARVVASAEGGAIEVLVGAASSSGSAWELAGLVVRPTAPLIAHLQQPAIAADDDVELTATATAPGGISELSVAFGSGGEPRVMQPMGGGGAYGITIAAAELSGDTIAYSFIATGQDGQIARSEEFAVPLIRGFESPRVQAVNSPSSWSRATPFELTASVEHAEFVREVKLHYREADQNARYRVESTTADATGRVAFSVDTSLLDDRYELLAYLELIDVYGSGSFAPNPFRDTRYWIARPEV